MVSTRAHKKCAVTKRAAYFNLIATDFPLPRQDFWIPPTFNGISTDKGTFASLGRRSVEVRDGRGRETVFSVYTELQDKPSVGERRLNQAVQCCIENGRAPRGNVLVIKHWAGCMDFTDIECWDRGIVNDIFQSHSQLKECSVPVHDGGSQYLFHRRLPTAIGHRILQESGLCEWTMVKRVSRFHSAEVSRFMDAQLLQLLKIYIKDAGALGSRVRILFSKTVSGFPMILGFGDTLGCCFVNGTGLYVGYPDDVTEKKVVIGHTGPHAMPPLYGQREFLLIVAGIAMACGAHSWMPVQPDIYGAAKWSKMKDCTRRLIFGSGIPGVHVKTRNALNITCVYYGIATSILH
ncbi:hypothetical protein GG344DRAFT_68177 [Lentinula edodes]|nr:hypothetical protein GG344DRAFT_68177 [Lentinula edodes]